MLLVLTVVPAKLFVPQGKFVALEHKSLIGAIGAVVHVLLIVKLPVVVLPLSQ